MEAIEAAQEVRNVNRSLNSVRPSQGSMPASVLAHPNEFARRHIGPSDAEARQMLELLGYADLDALSNQAVPAQIRLERPLELPAGRSEFEVVNALKEIASQNQVF